MHEPNQRFDQPLTFLGFLRRHLHELIFLQLQQALEVHLLLGELGIVRANPQVDERRF